MILELKDSWMKMVRSQIPRSWYHSQLVSSWGDLYEFRPERFLDENGQVTNTGKFVPFSVGKFPGEILMSSDRSERFLDENSQVTNIEKLVPVCVGKFLERS